LSLVNEVLLSGFYFPDAYKYVEIFEEKFAEYHNRRFGLMTQNCTSAIHLVLAGLGINNESDVIAPEATWIGSTAGITYLGADVVFADIEETNWCLSAATIEKVRTPRTKAIIAVDLYGNMPNWKELENYSALTGIPIIEDAAEALGSKLNNQPAGSFGLASVFSFHRTKTLTTGEGGMLLMDDEDLYARCLLLRDHGRSPGSFYNTEVAFKYMPSNLSAALGYGQFLRIGELIEIKRNIFLRFKKNLSHVKGLRMNQEDEKVFNGAWATTVVFDSNLGLKCDEVINELRALQIPARPFFYPLSSLPAYSKNLTGGESRNPQAYLSHKYGITLPCAMNLTDEDIDYISAALIQIIDKKI
jgi:perosamine synthetase